MFPDFFAIDIGPLLSALVEQHVLDGIREYQTSQDRRELVRGVAAGRPASQIILSQRRR